MHDLIESQSGFYFIMHVANLPWSPSELRRAITRFSWHILPIIFLPFRVDSEMNKEKDGKNSRGNLEYTNRDANPLLMTPLQSPDVPQLIFTHNNPPTTLPYTPACIQIPFRVLRYYLVKSAFQSCESRPYSQSDRPPS